MLPFASSGPLRLALVAIVVASAVGLVGCGQPVPPGKVRMQGVVNYDGQPLRTATGMITFFAAEGTNSNAAKIQPDGRFTVDLEPGEYRVGVQATDGYDRLAEKELKPIKAKSLIPEHYANPTKSGLSMTAVARAQPVTIALDKQTSE
jgi:hypothetical protein